MKNRTKIFSGILFFFCIYALAQNSTFSPYSRYGIGEPAQQTFAHNMGMAGTHIALKPDSTMPVFINAGNPASYALIRLTTLEVGGRYSYSDFRSVNSGLRAWTTNFTYGSVGVPIRGRGGLCFGILPVSYVGYSTQAINNEAVIGDVTYKYNGVGGLNKAFIGYGLSPFSKRLVQYRKKHLFVPDSMRKLSGSAYKTGEFVAKLLSDFSAGFNVNFVFGRISNNTRVIYPNSSLYNNTYFENALTMGDFTGNFGVQTAYTIDSVRAGDGKRRALRQKVKITFGYFMNLNNPMKAFYSSMAYNYILTGTGAELPRDTILYDTDKKSTIRLPAEQGFGIGFKKSERLNLAVDFAITDWTTFSHPDPAGTLLKNYRIAAGTNFVPEKYASGRGALGKRINYRLGVSYQTGYVSINNTAIKDYYVSAGLGLPVGIGRLSSMVNISAQFGRMGSGSDLLLLENYVRVHFGFTFSDRWFQKFRYD